ASEATRIFAPLRKDVTIDGQHPLRRPDRKLSMLTHVGISAPVVFLPQPEIQNREFNQSERATIQKRTKTKGSGTKASARRPSKGASKSTWYRSEEPPCHKASASAQRSAT